MSAFTLIDYVSYLIVTIAVTVTLICGCLMKLLDRCFSYSIMDMLLLAILVRFTPDIAMHNARIAVWLYTLS